MQSFGRADILLPKNVDFSKWAVIACDQFTSDPAYWQRVRETAGSAPSALNLILPEAELGAPNEKEHIAEINRTMVQYLQNGVFETYRNCYIYVERTLVNGTIRKGLIGAVDLEQYDYHPGAESDIRATERTVEERIPPRMRVREGASIELPHILLLCDDHEKVLIEPVEAEKAKLKPLYSFDLMEDGGHIKGWLVDGEIADAFDARLEAYAKTAYKKYEDLAGAPMTFAVGDGNHSLATAKACYEAKKKADPNAVNSAARYALVELENLHDDAQVFEPIHRVICKTDAPKLLAALKASACADTGFEVRWQMGSECGTASLNPKQGELAVAVLQNFLDAYLKENAGEIDYIHDDDALLELAKQPDSIGFLLPSMEKSQLFRGVIADGALPRKTFSMGHAREKRYYLEAREIR